MPRSPAQAKGLLLAAIASNDPVLFLEPKILYRAAVEQVPIEAYQIRLSSAEIVKEGKDVTVISYGHPLYTSSAAIAAAEKDLDVSIELVDLRTLYPWDRSTIIQSVRKTGRAVVVHESMINAGVGAEVAATIQEDAFLSLEAPVQRVGGWATHMGLIFEKFNVPDVTSKSDSTSGNRLTNKIVRSLRCNQTYIRVLMMGKLRVHFSESYHITSMGYQSATPSVCAPPDSGDPMHVLCLE